MAVIHHLDLATKRIYLAAGVREYHPVQDVYREIRTLRRDDESLRRFDMPVTASGNVAKGGGKFTPRYATFCRGWKIVPEDISHTLLVSGEQITDDGGSGPAAIDLTLLSSTSKIAVQYEPPAAEVIFAQGQGTSGDVASIAGEKAAASSLAASVNLMIFAKVQENGFAPTRVKFDTTLTLTQTDILKNRILYWKNGELYGAATRITGYRLLNGRGRLEVVTMPASPAAEDEFVIV